MNVGRLTSSQEIISITSFITPVCLEYPQILAGWDITHSFQPVMNQGHHLQCIGIAGVLILVGLP